MNNLSIILNQELKIPLSQDLIGNLVLDFSFENFSPNPTPVQTIKPVFRCTNDKYDAVKYIDNWIDVNGIYEGLPTKIQDDNTGTVYIDGILNLASTENEFSLKDGVYKIELKETRQSFFQLLEGFNLRSLYANPNIPANYRFQQSNIRSVRYVLSDVPDVGKAVSTSIVLYIVAVELKSIIEKIVELYAKFLGVISFQNASIGAYIWAGLELAFYIAYFIAVISFAKQLVEQIIDEVFPKQKGYLCIPVQIVLIRVCIALGYTFKSTLFDGIYSNMMVLPATSVTGSLYTRGFNNPIPDKTAAEFFNDIAKYFNAKIKVTDDREVIFENKFSFINQPVNFSLKDLKNAGHFAYNLGELPKSIKIGFIKDPIDSNTNIGAVAFGTQFLTKKRADGVSLIGDSITVNYAIKSKIDNLLTSEIDAKINFSRAFRKNSVSKFEYRLAEIQQIYSELAFYIYGLYDLTKNFASRLAGNTPTASDFVKQQKDGIGFMLLSGDYVGVDKLFILDGDTDKISPDNVNVVNADTVFEEFYKQEGPQFNQWQIIKGRDKEPILNPDDVVLIKNNNNVYDSTGRPILIEENKMDAFTGLHEISYRRKMIGTDRGFIPENIISTQKTLD